VRTAQGVALRFEFFDVANGFRLEVTPHDGDTLCFFGSQESLAAIREGLKDRLEDFKRAIGRALREDGSVELGEAIDEGFAILHREGLGLLDRLSAVDSDVPQLTLAVDRVLNRPHADPVPVVQVIAPQHLWTPIEFLAVENVEEHPRTGEELADACRRFLGLAAIVQRVISRPEGAPSLGLTQHRELLGSGGLPVVMFHDATLPAAKLERTMLEELPRLALKGPWPDTAGARTAILAGLVEQLRDPGLGPKGKRLDPPAQIHHFACHCDTRLENPDEHEIRLSSGPGSTADLKLSEIRSTRTAASAAAALRRRRQGEPPEDDTTPLSMVFLNACSSSLIDYRAAASFPDLFLGGGHRGFIGTGTDVPDEFAGRFGAWFYDALMSDQSVGEALHAAKWRMINERHNPLGILYSMFADPDLHVTGASQ